MSNFKNDVSKYRQLRFISRLRLHKEKNRAKRLKEAEANKLILGISSKLEMFTKVKKSINPKV